MSEDEILIFGLSVWLSGWPFGLFVRVYLFGVCAVGFMTEWGFINLE